MTGKGSATPQNGALFYVEHGSSGRELFHVEQRVYCFDSGLAVFPLSTAIKPKYRSINMQYRVQ
jgi:hypothetical protein